MVKAGKAKKTYEKWEYKKLFCTEFDFEFNDKKEQITAGEKYGEKVLVRDPVQLDPNLPLPSNARVTWALVQSSITHKWTNIETALNELGEEGWKVVGVTPPWSIGPTVVYSGHPIPYTKRDSNYFDILLMRSRV